MRVIYGAMFVSFLAINTLAALGQAIQPEIKPPGLTTEDGDKHVSLDLAKVEVRTVITGYVAETTETLTYHNPLSRVIQGDLDFPLPEGATVSGFGLDIDGQMVDGVPVPKDEARITFEKEVRKGVDPGLAEQAVGNTFRTRVYPIPANGNRTIKVQYVSDLTNVVMGDGAVSYRLPLRWGKAIADFAVHVEVLDSPSAPTIRGALPLGEMQQQDSKYITDFKAAAVNFASDLIIVLPVPPAQSAVVERRTTRTATVTDLEKNPTDGGDLNRLEKPEYYFCIHDQAPPEPQEFRTPIPRPVHSLGVCWDASLNRSDTIKTRELDVLAKVIARIHPQQVELIVFSNTAQPGRKFPIQNGDASAVIEAIKGVTYDGGLNLSCLDFGKAGDVAGTVANDFYLLFSSGLVNFGASRPSPVVPVYTFTSAAQADFGLLHHLAAVSGGLFFNLSRVNDTAVEGSFGEIAPYSLLRIEAREGEVKDVYPIGREVVLGRTAISGRLISPTATLVLHYGDGISEKSVTYHLKQADATETGIVPRLWAQMKLADLSGDLEKNADAIAALGREFNLVTSNTSLLVLETLQQYLTYKIVPPKTRTEIYKQFVEQIRQQTAATTQTREQRITDVVAMWNDRVKWWEAECKYDKGFVYRDGQPDAAPFPGLSFNNIADRSVQQQRELSGQLQTGRAESRPHVRQLAGQQGAAQDSVLLPTDDEDGAAKAVKDGQAAAGISDNHAEISIQPWDPNTPYLAAMKAAAGDQAYGVYLQQRKDFATAPAFYLDCADFLLSHGQRDLGVRVLSNIPALKMESPELLRIAGYRLRQIGEYDMAVDLFEKTLRMRPEEPQSYRDLALALADRAQSLAGQVPSGDAQSIAGPQDLAAADYGRALDLLYQVVLRPPDGRFPRIEVIAMEEANRILAMAELLQGSRKIINPIDPRLLKLMDLGLRVVMSWDTDATDIDLWVTEPSGEKCMYNHNRTTIGGMLSDDNTQGYGPEEYNVRRPMAGKYVIQANFFGSRAQAITGPTTIHVTIFTHWGRPDEKRQSLTVRLTDNKQVVDLGTVTVEP